MASLKCGSSMWVFAVGSTKVAWPTSAREGDICKGLKVGKLEKRSLPPSV